MAPIDPLANAVDASDGAARGRQNKNRISGTFQQAASLINAERSAGLQPLRMLQASPFLHWLANDEDFRNLARFFTVHHFSPGETLPESPFYLVASGHVRVQTETGSHEPVVHGRGAFFISATAQQEVSKRRKGRSLFAWLASPRKAS